MNKNMFEKLKRLLEKKKRYIVSLDDGTVLHHVYLQAYGASDLKKMLRDTVENIEEYQLVDIKHE